MIRPPSGDGTAANGVARVVAVGQNRRNLELIAELLSGEGFPTVSADSLDAFDRVLDVAEDLGLVLLDVAGFDQRVWERTERLRRMGVPFLVISTGPSRAAEEEGLARGARSVLRKPLGKDELIAVVRSLLGEV